MPTDTRPRDRFVAGLLMVLMVAVFAYTFTFPPPGQNFDPGVAAMPRIVAVVIFAAALLPLIWPRQGEKMPRGAGLLRVGGTAVLLLAYALVVDDVGFVIATVAFLVLELLLIGVRHWLPIVAMPLVTSIGLYVLFRDVLGVPLPVSGYGGLPF